MSEQPCAMGPIEACYAYTHMLLGGKIEEDIGPSGPVVRIQENTALLSSCGLAGTQLCVSPAKAWRKEVLSLCALRDVNVVLERVLLPDILSCWCDPHPV